MPIPKKIICPILSLVVNGVHSCPESEACKHWFNGQCIWVTFGMHVHLLKNITGDLNTNFKSLNVIMSDIEDSIKDGKETLKELKSTVKEIKDKI